MKKLVMVLALLFVIVSPNLQTTAKSKPVYSGSDIKAKYEKALIPVTLFQANNEEYYDTNAVLVGNNGTIIMERTYAGLSHIPYIKVKSGDGENKFTTVKAYDAKEELVGFQISSTTGFKVLPLTYTGTPAKGESLYVLTLDYKRNVVLTSAKVKSVNQKSSNHTKPVVLDMKRQEGIQNGIVFNKYGEFVGKTASYGGEITLTLTKTLKALKFNTNKSLADINELEFPTLKGEGTTNEIENSKDPSTEKYVYLKYAKGKFVGTMLNKNDIDYAYFYSTKFNKSIDFKFTVKDETIAQYFDVYLLEYTSDDTVKIPFVKQTLGNTTTFTLSFNIFEPTEYDVVIAAKENTPPIIENAGYELTYEYR
ncbi:MAG: hypothetical protein ACRCWQ_05520 [Bacilli bacterium]